MLGLLPIVVDQLFNDGEGTKPMANGILGGDSDDDRTMGQIASDAVAKAQANLQQGLYDIEDAQTQLDDLTTCPPAELHDEMKNLGPEAMDKMLKSLPDERKAELLVLAENTNDLDLKAKLYGGYLEGRVSDELGAHQRKEGDAADPAAKDYNGAINRAADGDKGEIKSEVAELQQQIKDGKLTDPKVITDMVERKEKELDLQMKYGVNLTTDKDKDGNLVKWKTDELGKLEGVIDKIPEQDRSRVLQFCRDDKSGAADHSEGNVHVHNGGISRLKGAFIHETAHNVEMNNPDVMKEYMDAAGWQQFKGGDGMLEFAKQNNLSPMEAVQKMVEIQLLRSKNELNVDGIEINGKMYRPGKYHDGVDCYDPVAVPSTGETDNSQDDWRDEWVYARTSPGEMFADHYKRAVRDPVGLYRDLVDRPNEAAAESKANLETLKNDPNASDEEIEEAQAEVDQNDLEQEKREKLWSIMRSKIFKVDDESVKVAAGQLDPAQQAAFTEQAKHCVTPEQLETLRNNYQAGKQVDTTAIQAQEADIPGGQLDSYRKDAANCFTPEQLDDLRKAYKEGRRTYRDWKKGANDTTSTGTPDIYLGWA